MASIAPPAIERRAFSDVRHSGRRLEGYAARFGVEARIGSISESVAPGAFTASLGGDVLALLDHSPMQVLGRTRSGTLRLSEDSQGLAFSLDLPDTQAGRDVLALAERKDLGGMSFGFVVPQGGDTWQGKHRTLRNVQLHEISVVSAWPAYPDTALAVRSLGDQDAARRNRQRQMIMAEHGIWA